MTDAEVVALWVRAYRRARAAVGKATHSDNLDARVARYHRLWCDRYTHPGWGTRFSSPKTRNICEYLMHLIDLARDGEICTSNPEYYTVMDEVLDD